MNDTHITPAPGDDRPAAVRLAGRGAADWRDAVRAQQQATASHADFYDLAAELVATLHALDDLAVLFAGQVGGYGQDRVLYDDTRTVDPAARLAEAVRWLRRAHFDLGAVTAAVNEFWNAIGHIGVQDVTP